MEREKLKEINLKLSDFAKLMLIGEVLIEDIKTNIWKWTF